MITPISHYARADYWHAIYRLRRHATPLLRHTLHYRITYITPLAIAIAIIIVTTLFSLRFHYASWYSHFYRYDFCAIDDIFSPHTLAIIYYYLRRLHWLHCHYAITAISHWYYYAITPLHYFTFIIITPFYYATPLLKITLSWDASLFILHLHYMMSYAITE